MRDLQQRIKTLESAIEADKNSVRYNQLLLQKKISSPPVLIGALFSSFGLGFYLLHPHFKKQVIPHLSKAPSLFAAIYKYSSLILPYIIV